MHTTCSFLLLLNPSIYTSITRSWHYFVLVLLVQHHHPAPFSPYTGSRSGRSGQFCALLSRGSLSIRAGSPQSPQLGQCIQQTRRPGTTKYSQLTPYSRSDRGDFSSELLHQSRSTVHKHRRQHVRQSSIFPTTSFVNALATGRAAASRE